MDYYGGSEGYTGPESATYDYTGSASSTNGYIGPSAPVNDYNTVPAAQAPTVNPRQKQPINESDGGYIYIEDDDISYSKQRPVMAENNGSPMNRPLPSTNIYQEPHITSGSEAKVYSEIKRRETSNQQQPTNNTVFVFGKTKCLVVMAIVAVLIIVLVAGIAYLIATLQAKTSTTAVSTVTETNSGQVTSTNPYPFQSTNVRGPSTSLSPPSNRRPISNQPTAAATPQPVTSASNIPQECRNATNFTRPWRTDNKGSDIHPGTGRHSQNGYACDLHSDLQWFRFTGQAGNRMLNTCPEDNSCGAKYPYWSDAEMPDVVGVIWEINVYYVYLTLCRLESRLAQVMRCSWDSDHDLIYRYTGAYESPCSSAFCGMF